jgi:hypothetical protein
MQHTCKVALFDKATNPAEAWHHLETKGQAEGCQAQLACQTHQTPLLVNLSEY